jgi:hypothetical protein
MPKPNADPAIGSVPDCEIGADTSGGEKLLQFLFFWNTTKNHADDALMRRLPPTTLIATAIFALVAIFLEGAEFLVGSATGPSGRVIANKFN